MAVSGLFRCVRGSSFIVALAGALTISSSFAQAKDEIKIDYPAFDVELKSFGFRMVEAKTEGQLICSLGKWYNMDETTTKVIAKFPVEITLKAYDDEIAFDIYRLNFPQGIQGSESFSSEALKGCTVKIPARGWVPPKELPTINDFVLAVGGACTAIQLEYRIGSDDRKEFANPFKFMGLLQSWWIEADSWDSIVANSPVIKDILAGRATDHLDDTDPAKAKPVKVRQAIWQKSTKSSHAIGASKVVVKVPQYIDPPSYPVCKP